MSLSSRAPARRAAAVCAAAVCAAAVLPAVAPAAGAQTGADSAARRPAARPASDSARRLTGVTVTRQRQRGYAVRRTTTATRTDTPLRDTPQAVSVVTRALIADQAMQGMGDVVRYVPGVVMGQGEGHRDAPTIRGQSTTADFFVDGVRDDVQYYRDLYNVERVEALKGSNAMIFGRGGGGGVINRVLKEAQWTPVRELSVQGGSWAQRRGALDVGQAFGGAVAARLNGMFEHTRGFREANDVHRAGVNPTLAVAAGPRTLVRAGFEHFTDRRVVDRGLPSFAGRPSDAPISTFFGDPDASRARLRLDAGDVLVTHEAGRGVTVRNRTRYASYDKFYQNVFASSAARDTAANVLGGRVVALGAYNSGTTRQNAFNQTDVTGTLATGGVRHTWLVGAEVGRQGTANTRQTGVWAGGRGQVTSTVVAFGAPLAATPAAYVRRAGDADNHVVATVAAAYVQDQVQLTPWLQAIAGLRLDRFALRLQNFNALTVDPATKAPVGTLERRDALLSPRAGLVVKPAERVSVYSSYSVSYLPSAGDQFSSLTLTSQALRPEQFVNREVGAKWDVAPALAVTAAAYRLDRSNTAAPDPTNPALTVQTGRQRTTGAELGLTGDVTRVWQVAGGLAVQRAEIVNPGLSGSAVTRAGATVPLVPRATASLWNRVQVAPRLGLGMGVIHQGRMYAAVDNAVTLPGFTRVDAAAFVPVGRGVRAQLNVENLLGARYFATSHGNNNIMPGAPRTVRLTLATGL